MTNSEPFSGLVMRISLFVRRNVRVRMNSRCITRLVKSIGVPQYVCAKSLSLCASYLTLRELSWKGG